MPAAGSAPDKLDCMNVAETQYVLGMWNAEMVSVSVP